MLPFRRFPRAARPGRNPSAIFAIRPAALVIQLALATALLGTVGRVPSVQAQVLGESAASQATAVRDYDIPAGPLPAALMRVATEAGIYLAGPAHLAQESTAPE